MNYKINDTSVCLDKFASLVVSFFFENHLKISVYRSKFLVFYCIFSSVSMQAVINLLPENVLNGEYAQ